MTKIMLRDGRYCYAREYGQGPAIIFLHGFGMNSVHWLPFALPLSLNYRIIIPDLRGFGHSHFTHYNQNCAISNYIEDLEDIVDHYAFHSFKLVAISMGALVSLKYLAESRQAKRVTGYMHIDQAPRCTNNKDWNWGLFGEDNAARFDRARTLVDRLQPFMERDIPFDWIPKPLKSELCFELGEFFAAATSVSWHKRLAQTFCRSEAFVKSILPMDNWPAYVYCLRSYLDQDYDVIPKLGKINTPVALAVGLKSGMYPCGGQLRIADKVKHCRIIPFEKSGHTPLIDQPIKLMKELRAMAAGQS